MHAMPNADIRPMVDAILNARLGLSLAEWIATRRADGATWQELEQGLTDATDGVVSVHYTTLIRWHKADTTEAVA